MNSGPQPIARDGDMLSPNDMRLSQDGRSLMGQVGKQKSFSIGLPAVTDHYSYQTTPRGQQPSSKRTVMRAVPVRTKSKQKFNEMMSKSAPNLTGSTGVDGADGDSFSQLSESVCRPPIEPTTGRRPNVARQIRPALNKRSTQSTSTQSMVPVGSTSGRTTKIRASELGIKIDKDTTPEELEEAVRRWKSEQKSKEVSAAAVLSNHEKKENREVFSGGFDGGGHQFHTTETNCAPSLGATSNSEFDPVGTETIPGKALELSGDREMPRSKSAEFVRGGKSPVRRASRSGDRRLPSRQVRPTTPNARARQGKSPGRPLTPTQRGRSSIRSNPKGRELSKSPVGGADYRPVSWRPEDSSMHGESDEGAKVRTSGRGSRPRLIIDENDEVQRRLREAGISIEQYRAILGVGLTIGLA